MVIPFEKYSDDTYGKILRNVAIGAGVILICVTVSSLTVTAAPAVSMIFAMAAETGAAYARSGAVIGFISSAVIHYLETGDLEESFKEGLLAGSEGFKVGAIVGSIEGAAFEISFLHKWHKKTNISWNDAARIQRESKYSLDFLQSVHSMEEYNVYKEAGLREYYVDGQHVLLPKDFDFDYVDPRTGMTNRDLMRKGNNPVSADGIYDWHHVGQKKDSPLALLTKSQHQKNYSILHPNRTKSEVRPGGDDSDWEKAKRIINRLLADWFL